jgi:hypothetical protein
MEQDFSLSPWAERPTSFLTRVRSIGEDLFDRERRYCASDHQNADRERRYCASDHQTPIASVGIARAITKKARSGDDP